MILYCKSCHNAVAVTTRREQSHHEMMLVRLSISDTMGDSEGGQGQNLICSVCGKPTGIEVRINRADPACEPGKTLLDQEQAAASADGARKLASGLVGMGERAAEAMGDKARPGVSIGELAAKDKPDEAGKVAAVDDQGMARMQVSRMVKITVDVPAILAEILRYVSEADVAECIEDTLSEINLCDHVAID